MHLKYIAFLFDYFIVEEAPLLFELSNAITQTNALHPSNYVS